jgi:hypothetical protein
MRLDNLRVVPCRRWVVGRRGIDAIDARSWAEGNGNRAQIVTGQAMPLVGFGFTLATCPPRSSGSDL